jgi:hypothetical protein
VYLIPEIKLIAMIEELIRMATVAETANAADNVANEIIEANLADDYLMAEAQQLKADADMMSEGMGYNRKKDLTNDIFDTDVKRDNYLSAFKFFLKAYSAWNKPPSSAAAALLTNTLAAYGKDVKILSYEKETATVDSILLKLEEAPMLAALTTLNLLELKQDLSDAQASFKALYKQSAAAESAKADLIAPSNVKRDVQNRLNTLTSYLNAMSLAKKEVYGTLAATIAELINMLNGKIRNRTGSNNKSDSTPLESN